MIPERTVEILIDQLERLGAALVKVESCTHEGYVHRNSALVWSERHLAELEELFPEERVSTSIVSQFVVNVLGDLIRGTNLRSAQEGETSWGDSQLKKWRAKYWRSKGLRSCAVCAERFHPSEARTFLLAAIDPDAPPHFFCAHHGIAAEALHDLAFSTPMILDRLGRQHAAFVSEQQAALGAPLGGRDAENGENA